LLLGFHRRDLRLERVVREPFVVTVVTDVSCRRIEAIDAADAAGEHSTLPVDGDRADVVAGQSVLRREQAEARDVGGRVVHEPDATLARRHPEAFVLVDDKAGDHAGRDPVALAEDAQTPAGSSGEPSLVELDPELSESVFDEGGWRQAARPPLVGANPDGAR
jgi:hypothetical protein